MALMSFLYCYRQPPVSLPAAMTRNDNRSNNKTARFMARHPLLIRDSLKLLTMPIYCILMTLGDQWRYDIGSPS